MVILKTRDQKVSELLNVFKLPSVDYTKGYQAKTRAKLVGGSAVCIEATRLNAVNDLLTMTRRLVW